MNTIRPRCRTAAVAAACLAAACAYGGGPFDSPALPVVTSWLGNTYPGAARWVPQDIDALCVGPDGRLFSNVHWDEGGGNCTEFKDGEVLGCARHTHGWGHQGGYAVAANTHHLFIGGRMGNENGNLVDPDTWPPKGFDWIGISRRSLANIREAAPFPGAKGGKGGTLRGAFLVVDEVPVERKAIDRRRAHITGLCASSNRLWAACPYDGTIKVFDAATMARLAAWPFERADSMALSPRGELWVLQEGDSNHPPRVVALDDSGRTMPREVRFEAGAEPSAICFAPDGRLLVADDGPRQQILIYENLDATPRPGATIGHAGGIHSGTSGVVGPLKFNRPRAVACDARGIIYVAHHGSTGGGSTVLEAYSPDLALMWQLLGQTFVDMADVDPADDTRVFTKEERFAMDYALPRGREATYRAYTVDRFRHPDDPRLHIWSAGAWVRRIGGRPFLFVSDMNSDRLQVYRFGKDPAAETAIPSGLFSRTGPRRDDWPPPQPASGEWIWRDADGDGAFDADEFDAAGADAPPSQGLWVDAAGGVWRASETKGIRHFPCAGLDSKGNPRWDSAPARSFPHPAGFKQVKRLRYDPATDTMLLGGTTGEHRNQHWKPMGPVLARYDGWRKSGGTADARWRVVLPHESGSKGHSSCEPMGFDIAGDFVFVPYTGASKALGVKTGRVEVFRIEDGRSVGHFEPAPDVGEIGLQDIRECLRAHRRADGEYLVFLEDDYKAKVLLYRWRP